MLAAVLAVQTAVQTAAQTAARAQAKVAPANSPPAAAPAPTLDKPATFTAADFAALPLVEDAVLSPNGQFMAGQFGINGERRVCALALTDAKAGTVCIAVPDRTDVLGVEWVNDDNFFVRLVSLVPSGIGTYNKYASRLVGVSRLTGKMTKLLWDIASHNVELVKVIWVAHDGSPTVLISAREDVGTLTAIGSGIFWPWVFCVNVETGNWTVVQGGLKLAIDWTADGAGRLRLGYGYDYREGRLRRTYFGEAGGNPLVTEQQEDVTLRDWITPAAILPGTDHGVIWRTKAAVDGKSLTSALYEIDLTTFKDVRQVWTAPEGSWISGVIVDENRTNVLGVDLRGNRDERLWIDPKLARLQAKFKKALPDFNVHFASISRDGTSMLLQIDRPDAPGALYYYNAAHGAMKKLAPVNARIGSEVLNPVRLFHYKARDGLDIEGVLTLPLGLPEKGLPVVVLPHGGPWAHDSVRYDYWAQFIAQLGYAVIQPNFRGSTGYGGGFERKGDGQMGLAMQDDLNDALKWAVDAGIVNPRRACIVGASYGGYAAMWGLARDPELWRCGISISGVASLRREVSDMGDFSQEVWRRMSSDFAAVSPMNAVSKITAPLLLIHGQKDVTVDHSQSVSMNARMKAAGKHVEFVSLPLADHYFRREPDRLVLLQSIERFLRANNPPD